MKNTFGRENTLINLENYTGTDIILTICNVCGYFEINTKYPTWITMQKDNKMASRMWNITGNKTT